jgi:hypothetical protein
LIPLGRTVNLNKLKDYVGDTLEKPDIDSGCHYRRLTRFFEEWGENEAFLHDIMVENLRLLKKIGCKILVMDGTSWKIGESDVHYMVLSILVWTSSLKL